MGVRCTARPSHGDLAPLQVDAERPELEHRGSSGAAPARAWRSATRMRASSSFTPKGLVR